MNGSLGSTQARLKKFLASKKTFQKLVENLLTESVTYGIIRLVVTQTVLLGSSTD